MRSLGEAVVAAAAERRVNAVGALSFQLYALTHEEMRERLAETNAEFIGGLRNNLYSSSPPMSCLCRRRSSSESFMR